MGRNRGKPRGGRGGGGGGRKGGRDTDGGEWRVFKNGEMRNAGFEEYYKGQGIVPEDEWEQFMGSLKEELPVTFRVTGSRAHAETINDIIKTSYVPQMQNVEFEGIKYDPPQSLSWYPNQLGWQLSAPKRVVRKTEPFKNFQRFLVGETEVGNLSRQEAVSMIPPLFLDVEPHHYCLDMCAAPGSKTAQIIEALNPHHTSSTGLLIANDSDYKRTHMLCHQTGRMPSKGLIITNFDASLFPSIKLGAGKTLQFDRILADVPCSGDGTLRKNLEIWSKWGAADGNSLHGLQLRILERAMNMLKPGGRLVYSTCSFNPSEDESVIATALNIRPGQFSIVDVSGQLPELKRRPGMSKWKVATQPVSAGREITWYETYEEYKNALEKGDEVVKDKGKALPSTLWPPSNAAELGLEKSMRLLPHDQNTGGFFVCVLQKAGGETTTETTNTSSSSLKRSAPSSPAPSSELETKRARDKSPVPQTSAEASTASTPAPAAPAGPSTKKERRDVTFKEDPLSYVDPENEEIKTIIKRFDLNESFPAHNLLVRNEYGDPLRTIYLTNDVVKTILQNNDYTRIRIISAGVKAFSRQDSSTRTDIECKWRTPIDGILEILPHVGQGIVVEAGLSELRTLLTEHYPPIETFEKKEWRDTMEKIAMGSVIVRFNAEKKEGEGAGEIRLPMWLPVWKAKMSLSLMIDKREKSILSLRTFAEDICNPPPPQKDGKDKTSASSEKGDVEGEGVEEEPVLNIGAGVGLVAEEAEIEMKEEEVVNA